MKTPTRPRVLPTPTLSGPQSIQVGKTFYGVPAHAGVVTVANGGIVYVLHQARLHAYVEQGELEIPTDLRRALASRYFGGARP